MSRPFEARYPGVCANCDEGFPVGEAVRYEGSEVVHADCDGVETSPARPEVVCPSCWLVHAGECP